MAKALIADYYGRGPAYSYFDGCSDGGREALIEAQRYPHDFNGILAGAPANIQSELVAEVGSWNIRVNTGPRGREILTSEKLPALHAAVVRACGQGQGYVPDPRACDFSPSSIECHGRVTNACLTAAQVGVVVSLYRGPTDPAGQSLYPGGEPYGSELGWPAWFVKPSGDRDWPQDTLSYQFATNFLRYLAYRTDPSSSYRLSQFHFTVSGYRQLTALAGVYDATDPDLSSFAAAGGRLIIDQGWADQAIPPFGTVAYYTAVADAAGGYPASQAFSRLYMIPAQYHCLAGGDPALAGADLLTPLIDWVQHGTPPGTLSFELASTKTPNTRTTACRVAVGGTARPTGAPALGVERPQRQLRLGRIVRPGRARLSGAPGPPDPTSRRVAGPPPACRGVRPPGRRRHRCARGDLVGTEGVEPSLEAV